MRRTFKVLWWVVLGPLGLLLLVAAAWVASNGRWADDPPTPLAAALTPRPVTLAAERNAFFDQLGLRAPAGESANDLGQRIWRAEVRDAGPHALVIPESTLWKCRSEDEDCVLRWRSAAQPLRAEMAATEDFGQRCLAFLKTEGYEEPVRELQTQGQLAGRNIADYPFPGFASLGLCLRRFQIEAALAADPQAASAHWARADALLRRVAGGTQTLLGQAVSWAWAKQHLLLLAQWVAVQPVVVPVDPTWLAPLPARVLRPHTWLVAEAHFGRDALQPLLSPGDRLYSTKPDRLQAWASRLSLGFLPNATQRLTDTVWLGRVESVGAAQGAALARRVEARAQPEPTGGWASLHWRNPVGHLLVGVAAASDYRDLLLRQADLVLYQQALPVAMAMNSLPVSERAAWLGQQALPADLGGRVSLEPGALVVKTWQSLRGGGPVKPARFALRPN